MIFIPGKIVGIVTFPGVIVHELAHQLFCRIYKVPVFEVCYFQTEDPLGYVVHEKPSSDFQATMISIGPFFLNTIVGFLLGFPATVQYKFHNANVLDYLLIYLAVSIAMHAFPSTGDAKNLWEHITGKNSSILSRLLISPIVGFIYLGALGSYFWLDALYGAAVALGLPWLVIRWLA